MFIDFKANFKVQLITRNGSCKLLLLCVKMLHGVP